MHFFATSRIAGDGTGGVDGADGPIAAIAEDVARTMLMIETGRRLWVNGVRVSSDTPTEATIVNDMGYCKTAMYVTKASVVMLLPHDVVPTSVIRRFIVRISTLLANIDEKMGDTDIYRVSDCPFNDATVHYTPTPSCLVADTPVRQITSWDRRHDATEGASGPIEKRLFVMGAHKDKTRRAAFTWRVFTKHAFQTENDGLESWVADQTTICIDFTGRGMTGVRSVRITDDASCLVAYGVPEDRIKHATVVVPPRYNRSDDLLRYRILVPSIGHSHDCIKNTPVSRTAYSSNHARDLAIHGISSFGSLRLVTLSATVSASDQQCGSDHASSLQQSAHGSQLVGSVGSEPARSGGSDILTRLLATDANAPADAAGVCQLCARQLWGNAYAVEAGAGPASRDVALATGVWIGVCSYCLFSEEMFCAISGAKAIRKFKHPRGFDEVAASYDLPVGVGEAIWSTDNTLALGLLVIVSGIPQSQVDLLMHAGTPYTIVLVNRQTGP